MNIIQTKVLTNASIRDMIKEFIKLKIMREYSLHKLFLDNAHSRIHKWIHYIDIYELHLERFREKSPVMVEIGVDKGGSLKMWKEYLGLGSKIIGIDINPNCKKLEGDGIQILIGKQDDPKVIDELFLHNQKIDIILDDGSHQMKDMINSFNLIYKRINDNGIYIVEDTHTSYNKKFGGGLNKDGTFIEFTKRKIDKLHALYSEGEFQGTEFTKSTRSINCYDGIVVFEKRRQGTRNDLFTDKMNIKNPKVIKSFIGKPDYSTKSFDVS